MKAVTVKKSALITVLLGALSPMLQAVEQESVIERFAVIGVIAQDSAKIRSGVAVVKDKLSQRSLLMRTGDRLPNTTSGDWRITSIGRQGIVLNDGTKDVTIGIGNVEDDKPTVANAESDGSGAASSNLKPVAAVNEDADNDFTPTHYSSDSQEKPRVVIERMPRSKLNDFDYRSEIKLEANEENSEELDDLENLDDLDDESEDEEAESFEGNQVDSLEKVTRFQEGHE